MVISRSAVRHRKFTERVNALALVVPRAVEIVDGAVWEICRQPAESGVYIEKIDVWQARLVHPPVLLLYGFNRRYVYMLTIISAETSLEF